MYYQPDTIVIINKLGQKIKENWNKKNNWKYLTCSFLLSIFFRFYSLIFLLCRRRRFLSLGLCLCGDLRLLSRNSLSFLYPNSASAVQNHLLGRLIFEEIAVISDEVEYLFEKSDRIWWIEGGSEWNGFRFGLGWWRGLFGGLFFFLEIRDNRHCWVC